jgi:hypothetical protein
MPDEGEGLSLYGSSDPEQGTGVGRLVSRHGTSGHTDGDVNFGANLRCGPPARHTRMTSGQPAKLEETLHGSGGCSAGRTKKIGHDGETKSDGHRVRRTRHPQVADRRVDIGFENVHHY